MLLKEPPPVSRTSEATSKALQLLLCMLTIHHIITLNSHHNIIQALSGHDTLFPFRGVEPMESIHLPTTPNFSHWISNVDDHGPFDVCAAIHAPSMLVTASPIKPPPRPGWRRRMGLLESACATYLSSYRHAAGIGAQWSSLQRLRESARFLSKKYGSCRNVSARRDSSRAENDCSCV